MKEITIPEAAEESFLDMEGRLIHADLWFEDDDGIVSSCILTMDGDDHDFECTPCSSLGFALEHDGLECDDAPLRHGVPLVPVDSGTLATIQTWADNNGY